MGGANTFIIPPSRGGPAHTAGPLPVGRTPTELVFERIAVAPCDSAVWRRDDVTCFHNTGVLSNGLPGARRAPGPRPRRRPTNQSPAAVECGGADRWDCFGCLGDLILSHLQPHAPEAGHAPTHHPFQQRGQRSGGGAGEGAESGGPHITLDLLTSSDPQRAGR